MDPRVHEDKYPTFRYEFPVPKSSCLGKIYIHLHFSEVRSAEHDAKGVKATVGKSNWLRSGVRRSPQHHCVERHPVMHWCYSPVRLEKGPEEPRLPCARGPA